MLTESVNFNYLFRVVTFIRHHRSSRAHITTVIRANTKEIEFSFKLSHFLYRFDWRSKRVNSLAIYDGM